MLLIEAKAEIDARITEAQKTEYYSHLPEYFEALEMASKALEAQMRLANYINDLEQAPVEGLLGPVFMSFMETLNECRWDWEEDEEE